MDATNLVKNVEHKNKPA